MQPLISVIVPVYNGQDYLQKCIESIEKQTYSNLEIIVVNDGSTDGTGKVCQKLAQHYENIHIITMNDEGVSAARNAGIEQADGEYLTFVDADDRLLPSMIQVLYEALEKAGGEIAGCGFVEWKTEEEWRSVSRNVLPLGEETICSSNEFLDKGILKGNSRCWSKLYRREAIGDLRFRKGLSIGEDMLFLVDLLPRTKTVVEIPYKGYGYFQNPKGAMNREFLPQYMDQITCWELARQKLSEKEQGKEAADGTIQVRITTILLMAIMLTAGKLALLSGKERRQQEQYVCICHEKIKQELKEKGAYKALSRGYKVKVFLFRWMPELYLALYHLRKYR